MCKYFFLLSFCFIISVSQSNDPDAPLWPQTFSQGFSQSDTQVNITVSGKLWYDIKNNRQRMEISPDYYDALCQSIGQDTNTSCNQIIVNDSLYVSLPQKNKCCKCCTSAQGCTVEPRDWLKQYKFVGQVQIKGQFFYQWSNSGQNYYATQDDEHKPRRIQADTYAIDFSLNSYSTDAISDSIFQLPLSSCNSECPKQTMCGSFISGEQKFSSLRQVFKGGSHKRNFKNKGEKLNLQTQ